MSRQIFWFILNAVSWFFGLAGLVWGVAITEPLYGGVAILFAIFLRFHATDIRRDTTK